MSFQRLGQDPAHRNLTAGEGCQCGPHLPNHHGLSDECGGVAVQQNGGKEVGTR